MADDPAGRRSSAGFLYFQDFNSRFWEMPGKYDDFSSWKFLYLYI